MSNIFKEANKNFKIVFEPKDREIYKKRRFGVGASSLEKYVGLVNAITAIERALREMNDKTTCKFRKHGKVDFYLK